jgi:light-regulated signal transduction histidine kinase (bacteriophytochrome)
MIGAFTEILVKRNQDGFDAESRTFTGYILDGVSRVESQLRDLLQYASAGSIEVKRELIDFNVILQSAIDNLRSTIIETGATVTCDRLPSLVANPDRIRSVFQNLIGNALKYRAAYPPEVHITAHREKEEWIFAVRDNGMGFAMDQADRIFKAFERLPSESKIQGSGLGLAILKRIVEGAGGRVWAESEPGAGSTFYFTLPATVERMGAARELPQSGGLSSSARAS